MLQGRANASPEVGWVVAHDVFHHDPDDTGTYAEETSTFGAETWLESHTPLSILLPKLQTSWASVMALVIEGSSRGVEGLKLRGEPGA